MRRGIAVAAGLGGAILIGWLLWSSPEKTQPKSIGSAVTLEATAPSSRITIAGTPAPTGPTAKRAEIALTISPLAEALNASDREITADLLLISAVFESFRTNFPQAGNPVGDNGEITAALTGKNALRLAAIAPDHRAINARRELCDRWGTPFFFHQLSGTEMEIRSAGPDRIFHTADDAVLTP